MARREHPVEIRIGPSKPEFHSNRHHRVFSNSENFSPLKGNTKEGKERSSISANRQNGKKFSPSVASTTSSSPRRPTPNSILSQLFYLQSLWNKSWKLVITVVFVVQVPLQLLQFFPSPRAGLSFPKCAFPSLSISMLSVSNVISDPSNIILIKSENLLKESLSKAREEALPAIFYFTAAWCGPCRLLAPVIKELSKNYPEVTTYKIDIDQVQLIVTVMTLRKGIIDSFPVVIAIYAFTLYCTVSLSSLALEMGHNEYWYSFYRKASKGL
ncbi:thioredoxin O2 [Cucumis melo var. makuwa]|uniref:Thioredoxin O2 n=1 Tax=Cucumis melo var. makuwa TaxID=1194695 RepID=A0A5A7UB97_CUCMM|nr:thioredoxin O2 [Cucumis melo var. makuwa]